MTLDILATTYMQTKWQAAAICNSGSSEAHLGILLISFQILAINQGLDALLEVLSSDGELELDEQLLH